MSGAEGRPVADDRARVIAEVLAAHRPEIQGSGGFFTCSCNRWGWGSQSDPTFAEHLAETVTNYATVAALSDTAAPEAALGLGLCDADRLLPPDERAELERDITALQRRGSAVPVPADATLTEAFRSEAMDPPDGLNPDAKSGWFLGMARAADLAQRAAADPDDRLITCPECRSTFEAEDCTIVPDTAADPRIEDIRALADDLDREAESLEWASSGGEVVAAAVKERRAAAVRIRAALGDQP